MKKVFSIILILCVLTAGSTSSVFAQTTNQLELGLSRDFGYGGFGNDIQGLFAIKVNNPPGNLTRVVFFIDTTSMGEDTQLPFSLQFNTDSYPLGVHDLSAIGYTSDGNEINSNKIRVQFVAAGTGTARIGEILGIIFGLILLMAVISVGVPLIFNKGKMSSLPLGAPRKYGIGGGAICPKCGRPFPIRLWWINLGRNRFDRCPYCGKWSFVRRQSMDELHAAEAAELSRSKPDTTIASETEAEKLKRELDDSRFHDT